LDEEALDYRVRSPWAFAPSAIRDDEPARRGRARAARNALADAVGAGLAAAAAPRGGRDLPSRIPLGSASPWSLELSGGPRWTWRQSRPAGHLRLDLPLAPGSIRLRWWHGLSPSHPDAAREVGVSLAADPFDQSISVGVRLVVGR
jgi:hypothetical protein